MGLYWRHTDARVYRFSSGRKSGPTLLAILLSHRSDHRWFDRHPINLVLHLFRKVPFSILAPLLIRWGIERKINQPVCELPVQPRNAFFFCPVRVFELPLHNLCESPAGPRPRLFRSRCNSRQVLSLSINSGLDVTDPRGRIANTVSIGFSFPTSTRLSS